MSTIIYSARRILTMNPSNAEASHVAVREGRILGAGPLEDLVGWGDYTINDCFAEKILMPGLVEGHSHIMEGTFWRYVYCGYFDRLDPEGQVWRGAASIDEVIGVLSKASERLNNAETPLAGWSLDPIYFGNKR